MKFEQLDNKYIKPYNYPTEDFKFDLFWTLHSFCQEVIYGSLYVAKDAIELEEDIKHYKFLNKYRL